MRDAKNEPKVRAARRGLRTEAEIRHLLEATARPPKRVKLGSLLAGIGRDVGLTDTEWAAFDKGLRRDDAGEGSPLDLSPAPKPD